MSDDFAKYGEWTDCCDEHVMFVRELSDMEGRAFECLKVVPHMDDDHTLSMLHEVIFTDDFVFTNCLGEDALNQVLRGFGYKDIDDYVRDISGDEDWIYHKDGSVDRNASPSWTVDWAHLASLMCESHDHGLKLTPDDAKHTVQRIAHVDIPLDFFKELAGCEMERRPLDLRIQSASQQTTDSKSTQMKAIGREPEI